MYTVKHLLVHDKRYVRTYVQVLLRTREPRIFNFPTFSRSRTTFPTIACTCLWKRNPNESQVDSVTAYKKRKVPKEHFLRRIESFLIVDPELLIESKRLNKYLRLGVTKHFVSKEFPKHARFVLELCFVEKINRRKYRYANKYFTAIVFRSFFDFTFLDMRIYIFVLFY